MAYSDHDRGSLQEAKQHLANGAGGDADDESDGLLDGEHGDLGSDDDDVEEVSDDYITRLTGQVHLAPQTRKYEWP